MFSAKEEMKCLGVVLKQFVNRLQSGRPMARDNAAALNQKGSVEWYLAAAETNMNKSHCSIEYNDIYGRTIQLFAQCLTHELAFCIRYFAPIFQHFDDFRMAFYFAVASGVFPTH